MNGPGPIAICCDVVSVVAGVCAIVLYCVGEIHAAWGCVFVGVGWQVVRVLQERVNEQ